jgi:hypothetical protein
MKSGFLSRLFGGSKRKALAEEPRLAEAFLTTASEEEVAQLLERLKRPRQLWCPLYTKDDRDAVWHKGQPIVGWDPDEWRVDHNGSALFREAFGDSASAFGWEIGHVVPPGEGGLEVLSNWRPQLIREASPVVERRRAAGGRQAGGA